MICIWSSWCHCHPIISCSSKIQNGLPFWYRLIQVVLEKRPLNGCRVVVVLSSTNKYYRYCLYKETILIISFFILCTTYFNKATQSHAIVPLSAVDVVEQYWWICRNTRCHHWTFRATNCYVIANETQQLWILSKLSTPRTTSANEM